jgi:cell wall-associated NlpC family hydrolase
MTEANGVRATRAQVVTAARGWLGVPWRHQGRTRHGVDCVGLVVLVRRELGLGDEDLGGYRREPDGHRLLEAAAAVMDRIPVIEARDGDVLLLRDSLMPCHVGILSTLRGRPHLVHAYVADRAVSEDPLAAVAVDARGGDARVAAFRFRGIED